MLTFQDLQKVENSDEKHMAFVLDAIAAHKNSDLYKTAVTAYEYDKKQNTTIMQYEKTLTKVTGQVVPDRFSLNHKVVSNFFDKFVIQQNQFLPRVWEKDWSK